RRDRLVRQAAPPTRPNAVLRTAPGTRGSHYAWRTKPFQRHPQSGCSPLVNNLGEWVSWNRGTAGGGQRGGGGQEAAKPPLGPSSSGRPLPAVPLLRETHSPSEKNT